MIFPWIFRRLPGPKWLRIVQLFILATLLVLALFEWVFPALDGLLSEPIVESALQSNNGSSLLIWEKGEF